MVVERSVAAHAEVHRERGEQPRKQRTAAQQRVFAAVNLLGVAVVLHHEVVAGVAHLALHIVERNHVRVIVDEHRACRQSYCSRVDAPQLTERILYVGGADNARHTYNWYCLFHTDFFYNLNAKL